MDVKDQTRQTPKRPENRYRTAPGAWKPVSRMEATRQWVLHSARRSNIHKSSAPGQSLIRSALCDAELKHKFPQRDSMMDI